MEKCVLYYSILYERFLPVGYGLPFNAYPKFRATREVPDASIFDEMHDSEYPLCLLQGCTEHVTQFGSFGLYPLYEADICICSEFRCYKAKQSDRRLAELDRYIIYVYDCNSSK